jgi:hypothetical protein
LSLNSYALNPHWWGWESNQKKSILPGEFSSPDNPVMMPTVDESRATELKATGETNNASQT